MICRSCRGPVLEVRNSRRETKPKERAEGENMVGDAAAIGVVTMGHDLGLMIKQRIQDIQRLAGGRRNRFDVKRRIATGDVGLELGSGIVAVMSVKAGGGAATAAGPEELAVRRGSHASPKSPRAARAAAGQPAAGAPWHRSVTDMPFGRRGESAESGDAAGFGHARQTKIEPLGKEARHQVCGSPMISPARRWVKQ